MTDRDLPSPDILRKMLRYEPETGKLYWRKRPPEMFEGGTYPAARRCASWNSRCANTEALNFRKSDGYRVGSFFGERLSAHRAAFVIAHGRWPVEVDHVNGDPGDNRIANLREVDHMQNMRNQKLYRTNTSGQAGVHYDRVSGKWIARINEGGGKRSIGRYGSKEAAFQAAQAIRDQRGFHPNHGRNLPNP